MSKGSAKRQNDELILIARKPTHPGEMLREEFMPDYGLSVASLGRLLGVSRQSANDLVREKRSVSPEMALRLARVFDTSPQYWLNLQRNVDLWDSMELHCDEIMGLAPIAAAS